MKASVIRLVAVAVSMVLATSGVDARAVEEGESFQNTFATCIVRDNPARARRFVVGLDRAPLGNRCLGQDWSQVSFRVTSLRYALAKVLLQRDYAEGIPPQIAEVELPVNVATRTERRSDDDADRQRQIIADCVVRRTPTKAYALVGVEAGDEAAQPAMSQLQAILTECSEGTQVRYLTGFQMHEAIVTRMYQLAYAARKPHDA